LLKEILIFKLREMVTGVTKRLGEEMMGRLSDKKTWINGD